MKRLFCTLSVLALVAVTAVPAFADDLIFHDLAPCRLIDTRDGSGASTSDDGPTGPLASPGPHFFRLQGFCGIPDGAIAAELNFSVITPSKGGDLRAFPADGPNPVVGTMSYEPGILALSNSLIVPLGAVSLPADNDLKVLIGMVGTGTIQLAIDVTGYLSSFVVVAGDITGVTGGTGLSETPAGGTAGDVTVDIEASYQLPQVCGDGQVPVWIDSSDTWGCGGSVGGGGFGFGKDGIYVVETGTGNFAAGTRDSSTAACEDGNDIPLGGGCEVPPGQQPDGNDPGVVVEHFTNANYDTTSTAAALTCTFFNNDSETRNANAWLACVCVPPFVPLGPCV